MLRYAALVGVVLMCCDGCSTTGSVSLGENILLTTTSSEFQMLKPGRSHRGCTTRVGWRRQSGALQPFAAVLAEILADSPNADGLASLRFTWTERNFLLVRRECLEVSADVVRTIRVISLPTSGHAH
jgi:hypothetical protein